MYKLSNMMCEMSISLHKGIITLLLIFSFLFIANTANAQWEYREILNNDNVTYPENSKMAEVSNTIGITEIRIKYHRPGAKNRVVFGELIPYNKIWRAGANESTTISFQDSVTVNGNKMAPGIYGIHMIPGVDEWTIIFSTNHNQWGSFYYDESEDALRINVVPRSAPHQELLKYDFENIANNSLEVELKWGVTKVSFEVEVDEVSTTLAVMRDELRTLPRFRWHGNREAAMYCWIKDVNYVEATDWIDRSIRLDKNFKNLYIKALLEKMGGNQATFNKLMTEVQTMGEEKDFMYMAMEVLGHHNNPAKATELFDYAIKYYPESSQIRSQLANAYGLVGEQEKARETLRMASTLAKSERDHKLVNTIKRRFQL